MIVVMAIGLFTSRIVLQALGVEDYGIYNLVGGLVIFFTIVNAAMLSATQRYINYGLGKGDREYLKQTFKTAILIHLILALIILVFAETLGLWLLTHKLLIPEDKSGVAMFVFQTSICAVIIQVITLPYNAVVVAHEQMSVFATLSIIQSILSLSAALFLLTVNSDRLILYALLTCIVQIIVAFFYLLYCRRTFEESKGSSRFNKSLFKEMSSFAGWCMIGVSAGMMYGQGINILLGMFFLPFVNAARGIAVTVQGAVGQIFNNVQTAVLPQLMQSYAKKDFEYFKFLIYKSCKYFAFLLLLVGIPFIIRTPQILKLWLGEVPEYSVIFTRILIGITLIDAISAPLMRASDATGDIRKYHLVVGGVLMTIVPIAYLFLKLGYPPQCAFYTYFAVSIVALVARLIILHQKIELSIRLFVSSVILPILIVLITSFPISSIVSAHCEPSFLGLLLFLCSSTIITMTSVGIFGISKTERITIKRKVLQIFSKLK